MEGGDGFEGGADWRIEGRPELGDLRRGFLYIVNKGTKEELARLIDKHPQRDKNGNLVWLLTSGMVVDIATGEERPHHDLDVVVMDPKNRHEWELLGTDNVTPGQYWANMRFNPLYLEKTLTTLKFSLEDRTFRVLTVHPALIMAQKLSNAFGRDPREKDISDAISVATWWKKQQRGNATWINIVNKTIEALPEDQREITESRIIYVISVVLFLAAGKRLTDSNSNKGN